MIKRIVLLLFFLLHFIQNEAQVLFRQSAYNGGVTGISYSLTGLGKGIYESAATFTLSPNIPPSSTIKKAYLFSVRYLYYRTLPYIDHPIDILFNGSTVRIDSSNIVSSYNYGFVNILCNDVTALVSNSQLNYPVSVPDQYEHLQSAPNEGWVYNEYYLYIEYENASLPVVNSCVVLNKQDNDETMNYSLTNLNPIDMSKDVGFAVWHSFICTINPQQPEDEEVVINGNSIGFVNSLIPGNNCSTTSSGDFYYENNTLYALADDTANNTVNGIDALANINTYLTSSISPINVTFNHAPLFPGHAELKGNYIHGMFLSYSTPCPAAASKDTSIAICRGQSVQLSASAGYSNYNWYPRAGLNDSTVINPVATPLQNTNYIAYVKDAAGCMHTEHTQIIVHGKPMPDSLHIINAVCGTSGGTLLIEPNYHDYPLYTYNIGSGATTDTSITNIVAGNYTLTVTDNIGCTYQSNFTITETNPVTANFSTQTAGSSIIAPLFVSFANSSAGANNYNWYFPTGIVTTFNTTYTFTESGTYTVTLIAYNNIPTCADTATVTIIVLPQDTSGIFIPNVFSPNGDGVNDVFEVSSTLNLTLQSFEIYNRFGIRVFSSDELIQAYGATLKTVSWDGRTTSGMPCSEGTYFYVIELKDQKGENKSYKGFLSLVR